MEVLLCAKGDRKAYTTYGVRSISGHNSVEGFVTSSLLQKLNSILHSVYVKMMFRLVPLSMRVLGNQDPLTMGLTTSG
jgi:hypothetical protein